MDEINIKDRLAEILIEIDKETLSFHNLSLLQEMSELLRNAEEVNVPLATQEATHQTSEQTEQKKKVFILDDDKNIQNLLRIYLERAGYEVISFFNPLEALKQLKNNRPDLFLIDIMMPEMTGIEFINKIKSKINIEKTKVLVGSYKNNPIDKTNAINAGASDYIQKPYNLPELLHLVKKYC